jgi:hypothetical protein
VGGGSCVDCCRLKDEERSYVQTVQPRNLSTPNLFNSMVSANMKALQQFRVLFCKISSDAGTVGKIQAQTLSVDFLLDFLDTWVAGGLGLGLGLGVGLSLPQAP